MSYDNFILDQFNLHLAQVIVIVSRLPCLKVSPIFRAST